MVVFLVIDPNEAANIVNQIVDSRRAAGQITIYTSPVATWPDRLRKGCPPNQLTITDSEGNLHRYIPESILDEQKRRQSR